MKPKVTIYDIAKTAGVSPATVSRMIHQPEIVSEQTRGKVLQAFFFHQIEPEDLSIKKTTPQAGKNASQTRSVLVCIPSWGSNFHNDILDGIQDCLDRLSFHMVVTSEIPRRSSMPSFLQFCADLHIAGVILMYQLAEDLLKQLDAVYPVVQCSEYNPLVQDIPYVSIDDYAVSKLAVAHLLGAGCRKIAFFSSPYNYRHVQNRYRAYKSMLLGNGLDIRPEYAVQVPGFQYDRILSAARQFFRLDDPPDAIFATSDQHAHAAIKAGQDMGFKIPEEIRVFGFDNTLYAALSTPAISTVAQPYSELGVQSCMLLLERIKNPRLLCRPILLPAHLLIQGSA